MTVVILLLLAAFALPGNVVWGADAPSGDSTLAASAFVPGFERFGRHADEVQTADGRLLLTELSCTACHASGPSVAGKKSGSALVAKGGPDLNAVGNRVRRVWLEKYLQAPHIAKPGTTMPDVLAAVPPDRKQRVLDALVAFLSTQTKPFPEMKASGASAVPERFWMLGDVDAGRRLYHRIGCVACHQPDPDYETVEVKPSPLDEVLQQLDPEEIRDLGLEAKARPVGSVPLPDVQAKYTTQSLTWFLINPHAARPAGRMPRFDLNVVQAADIAAWLMQMTSRKSVGIRHELPVPSADTSVKKLAAEGRQYFASLGCANCHQVQGVTSTFKAERLGQLRPGANPGCLQAVPDSAPDYVLDSQQQEHLRLALAEFQAQPAKPWQTEHLSQTLMQFNCYGCHERDDRGGVGRFRKAYFETFGNVDIGDEGRLPPPLTGVGRKLKPAWLQKVFDGSGRIRPFMRIQMPAFPKPQMQQLAADLLATDQTNEVRKVVVQADRAEAGRTLFNTGCVQCHPFRNEALPGVVGIDLQSPAARLQPGWFHDFLLDPGSLKPRTRMPTFFKGGVGQLKTVLDGNAEHQISALWTYLNDATQPLPDRIQQARSQNYELVPRERPLLLRTFMKEAGTHAIAVGFPQKMHFAFDAEQVRPAFAWRGRFLDALGTWFVRFAPPAEPLGSEGVAFPAGPTAAVLASPAESWPQAGDHAVLKANNATMAPRLRFQGYRLDADGTPTFLYQLGGVKIQDRFVPTDDGWQRMVDVQSQQNARTDGGTVFLRLLASPAISGNAGDGYQDEAGLQVLVTKPTASAVLRKSADGEHELLLPVPSQPQTTLEILYRW